MAVPEASGSADLEYRIVEDRPRATYRLLRDGSAPIDAHGHDDLLFVLEKDIVIEIQRRRAELYFLHSAVLERHNRAFLFAADSGSGKSTTTWALLHHGFRYLSDELAPIDLPAMKVSPYPRGLCLKQRPPAPYALPRETIDLGRTLHVPTSQLPSGPLIDEPVSIGGVFLVQYCPELNAPELRRMSPAEAGSRLYVVALNALAHPNRGLDAAIRIATSVPCFRISTSVLPATCASICAAVDEIS